MTPLRLDHTGQWRLVDSESGGDDSGDGMTAFAKLTNIAVAEALGLAA